VVREFDDGLLKIDFAKYSAAKKQRPLRLSPLEFKLLKFLIARKGEIISRPELLENVWGYATSPLTRTVDACILSLRKKIGRNYISTLHGKGYRFESKA
jgi:DNA-binding response OmpR family regulator